MQDWSVVTTGDNETMSENVFEHMLRIRSWNLENHWLCFSYKCAEIFDNFLQMSKKKQPNLFRN